MKGLADIVAFALLSLTLIVSLGIGSDTIGIAEESVSGNILDVIASREFFGDTNFSIALDLDNGSIVICPVQSDKLGGTLYRLYRNRKPDLPRLRETARVQVGRHSGSVVCRGLGNGKERTMSREIGDCR